MTEYCIRINHSNTCFRCKRDVPLLTAYERMPIAPEPLTDTVAENFRNIIPVGCRGGGCGRCKIKILTGQYRTKKMSRLHVSEQQQAQGLALACCVYPQSDLLIEPVCETT